MRKILISVIFLFNIFSCYSIKTPMSKYNVKEVTSFASEYVKDRVGEVIEYKDAKIIKRGYGMWYVTLYGVNKLHHLNINEDGKVVKYTTEEYEK